MGWSRCHASLPKGHKQFEFPIDPQIEIDNPQIAMKRFVLIRILEAFFGKEFHEVVKDISLDLAEKIDEIIPLDYKISKKEFKYISRHMPDLSRNREYREDITEYNKDSPLIVTKRTQTKIEVTILHESIKDPSFKAKQETLNRISTAEFITEVTKNKIRNLEDRINSTRIVVRQAASEEASRLLLKDFYYSKNSLIKLWEQSIFEEQKDVWAAILRPDISTVVYRPPLLLKENLSINDISSQISNEINRSSDLNTFLNWLLKEYFFIPLDYPLNPWKFIGEYIKKKKISSKDVLYFLIKWIDGNNDPLANLITLEVVLNLRANAEKDEKNEFVGDRFFNFLNQLFEVLLMENREDVSMDKNAFENVKARWNFRLEFSRYYLKYIDLNFNKPMDDEYKVVLAWWLASEVEILLLKYLSKFPLEKQTLVLKQNSEKIKMENYIFLEHQLKFKEKEFSVARYYTTVIFPSLTALTLAVIYPMDKNKNTFKGLKEPTIAFNPKFTNVVIHSLIDINLLGIGQIQEVPKRKFNFLWELPLFVSATGFLRTYYGDAFKFLGKDKVELIEFSEEISKPEFLKKHLAEFPKLLESKSLVLAIILSLIESYVQLYGKMPQDASKLKEQKNWIQKLILLNVPLNAFCLKKVTSILMRLILAGDSEWVYILGNQLKNVDYGNLLSRKNEMEMLTWELLTIVILGYDLSILKPVIKRKSTDKIIREILGRIKPYLESFVTRVPAEYRENLRKFLNEIADVPAIVEENKS